jgi:hypothetical protein
MTQVQSSSFKYAITAPLYIFQSYPVIPHHTPISPSYPTYPSYPTTSTLFLGEGCEKGSCKGFIKQGAPVFLAYLQEVLHSLQRASAATKLYECGVGQFK